MNSKIEMLVSPICSKDGNVFAYVQFADGDKLAEGKIPECKIEKNKGFSDDEVAQLEEYMKNELSTLKETAAGINPLGAFMGKGSKK